MKLKRNQVLAVAGCTALLLSGIAMGRAQSGDASAADKAFVKNALQGGMAEVKMGQLAAQKGNSDDVKQFGQKMVIDHTKLGDQMKPIAAQIGVTPPTMIAPMDKATETKLESLSGDAFDKAYIRTMVKDHKKDLADFKNEVATGQSSAVKEAATQGEQVISQHLQMIQDIAQKHGVGGGMKSSGGMSGDAH